MFPKKKTASRLSLAVAAALLLLPCGSLAYYDPSATAAVIVGGSPTADGDVALDTAEIFGCPGEVDSYQLQTYPR